MPTESYIEQLERVRKSIYVNTDIACRFVLAELLGRPV